MAGTPLSKRLFVRAGNSVALLDAPEGAAAWLSPLPEGAVIKTAARGKFDVVLAFVRNVRALDTVGPKALSAVGPKGILWLAYPKKSSATKTDISRDVGWDVLVNAGWEIVSIVSIDDTWSAVRFKPVAAK